MLNAIAFPCGSVVLEMQCAPSQLPLVSQSLSSARANDWLLCTATTQAPGSLIMWHCCPSSRPGTMLGGSIGHVYFKYSISPPAPH